MEAFTVQRVISEVLQAGHDCHLRGVIYQNWMPKACNWADKMTEGDQ